MTLDAINLKIYLFFFPLFLQLQFCPLSMLLPLSLLNGCARDKSNLTLAPIPESYTMMPGLSSLSVY